MLRLLLEALAVRVTAGPAVEPDGLRTLQTDEHDGSGTRDPFGVAVEVLLAGPLPEADHCFCESLQRIPCQDPRLHEIHPFALRGRHR